MNIRKGELIMGRVTKHARKRIRERVITNQSPISLLNTVSRKGKTKGMYEGKFHQYLTSKSINGKIAKVYKDNIYILTKNTRRLITTFKIPEKYLPVEQYEITKEKIALSNKVYNFSNQPVIVELKNNEVLNGYIINEKEKGIITNFILFEEDEMIKMDLVDIKNIVLDRNIIDSPLKI